MKAVVGAFNQEKALVGASSVITDLRMDPCFKLYYTPSYALHVAVYHHTTSQRGRGRGMLTDSLWPRSTATTLQTVLYALFRANVLLPGA